MDWKDVYDDEDIRENLLFEELQDVDEFANISRSLNTHKTREGISMAIPSMNDSHLLSTVKLFVEYAIKAKQIIADSKDQNLKEQAELEKLLYGIQFEIDINSIKKSFQNIMIRLPFYINELFLRGINDETLFENLRILHGRNTALKKDRLSILLEEI